MKTVVLGVSGGIAAYKACELASQLTQQGVAVHVVPTASAQRFVAPITFQALTHLPVHTSLWTGTADDATGSYAAMPHIALADVADAVVIAPASADIIAKLAHGLADDLLTTLVLATTAPVLVAPAMNPCMLAHPATQRNIATLQQLGYRIIDPESGRMACEHVGTGRLPATEVLIEALRAATSLQATVRDLTGRRILVTAGPTREPLDPVRYISNRSSGRMGYSIAIEAIARGAAVTLISGPNNLPTPDGVDLIDVTTTQEMYDAVQKHAATNHIVIGAAAPADYRMATPASHKLKKRGAGVALTLELEACPDIIAAVGKHRQPGQMVIGFAAETKNTVVEGRRKLSAKHLDAIVANDVTEAGAGFDVDTNRVTWITADATEEWPLLTKREVAARILDRTAGLLPVVEPPKR
jgi:phosphopantothenoylcysteine decarboxylase/phosphopantothenate--cysteine ligase